MARSPVVAAVLALLGCASEPFYTPCDASGRCPEGYVCADRETLRVCTVFCTTSGECTSRFGASAFCSTAGLCLVACARDEDYPTTAYCDVGTGTCRR